MKPLSNLESVSQSPLAILCEWAWTKVNLENLQQEYRKQPSTELESKIESAIPAYKHALRKKRKLDSDYREHHEALWVLEQQATKPQLEFSFA